jgi:hypothetical protein
MPAIANALPAAMCPRIDGMLGSNSYLRPADDIGNRTGRLATELADLGNYETFCGFYAQFIGLRRFK